MLTCFTYFVRLSVLSFLLLISCKTRNNPAYIQHVNGEEVIDSHAVWLTHEHILVDFIGADRIRPESWDHAEIMATILPYLAPLAENNVVYFVDATPNYLGRDVRLLQQIATQTGLKIITNTGFYGAVGNKYIPDFAFAMTPNQLAELWILEFKNGIDGTTIKPGFIKISVDSSDPLDTMHQKLVKAAAITHRAIGLTIASHTGTALGLWPQLEILAAEGVQPSAFIWVHAQMEQDLSLYDKAANVGCWISLDGLGWEIDDHVAKLIYAKEKGFLSRILISHDAGWYDPQKNVQEINGYERIFNEVIPALKEKGFTDNEIQTLLVRNPAKAFSIQKRLVK